MREISNGRCLCRVFLASHLESEPTNCTVLLCPCQLYKRCYVSCPASLLMDPQRQHRNQTTKLTSTTYLGTYNTLHAALLRGANQYAFDMI